MHEYSNEENTTKAKQKCHNNESVRSLEFNITGSSLVSGGADKSFQIMDTVRGFLFLQMTYSEKG